MRLKIELRGDTREDDRYGTVLAQTDMWVDDLTAWQVFMAAMETLTEPVVLIAPEARPDPKPGKP
jgi:hypothetical protein